MDEKLITKEKEKLEDTHDYKNSNLPIELRVHDLLSKMTLKEKVAQMLCVWGQKKDYFLDEENNVDYEKMKSKLNNGLGQIGRLSDTNGGLSPVEMAEMSNNLQKYLIQVLKYDFCPTRAFEVRQAPQKHFLEGQ